uniref:receptor-type tyrosine-protein phosphatase H-like isoform X2 n=1 Tax=Myxine glutinosa TaxID=7769 RepID=UPI00358F4257
MADILEVEPQRWNLQQVLLLVVLQVLAFSLGVQSYPSPPENLQISTQNSTSLSISWTNPNDTNQADYEYLVMLIIDNITVENETTGRTNITFSNLPPGTDYNVSVSTIYNDTQSQATEIPATTDPSPPQNPQISTQKSTSLSISWTKPNDTNQARYEYLVILIIDNITVENETTGQTYITFSNLSPGTDYNMYVSSLYHGRKSQAVEIPATTNPSPPENIQISTQNSTSLSISWTNPNDRNQARYEYLVMLIIDNIMKVNETTGQTYITFSNLPPGTDYTVSVSTIYNDTQSQPTEIPAPTDPSPPENPQISTQNSTSLSISWTNPNDRNQADYEYLVMLIIDNNMVENETTGQTYITFSNLSPGTDYNMYVSSLYHGRQSQAVEIPATTNPSPPENLQISTQNSTSLSISWTNPNDTNQARYEYIVMLIIDNITVENETTGQTNITFSNLPPGTDYNVSVSTIYNDTQSQPTEIPATTDPSPPENPQISTQNSTSLSISWTNPNDRNQADYEYLVMLIIDNNPVKNETTGQTYITFSDLSPGTDYNMYVSSLYHGRQSQAVEILATTNPSPPENLQISTQNSTSLSISWTNPNDTNQARYEYIVMLIIDNITVENETTGQTNITFSNLPPGTDYNVSVSTIYNDTQSQPTEIPATTDPSPPENPQISTQNSTSLSISWTNPNDTNQARYEYLVMLIIDNIMKVNETTGQTYITFSNLPPGTDYTVSVSTIYNYRKSEATEIPATTDPSPPQNPLISTQNSTSLSISWTNPNDTNQARYEYIVMLIIDNKINPVKNETTGQTTITFSDLSPGTDYNMYVSSLYHGRQSQAVEIPATTNPSPPENLQISTYNSTSLSISWTKPNDTNQARYEYIVMLIIDNITVENETTGRTNITFSNLPPGTDYNVSVSTIYNDTQSQPTEISATTDPSPPENPQISTQNSTSLSISWTKPNDTNQAAYEYLVMLIFDNKPVKNETTGQTAITFSNLSPGTDYNMNVSSLYHGRQSQAVEISATTNPSPPENPQILTQNSTSLSISWTNPNDINQADYEYLVMLIIDNNMVENETTGQTYITFSNLSPGTDYNMNVSSLYHGRQSQAVEIPATTIPTTPNMDITKSQTSITLEWKPSQSGKAVFYKISYERTRSTILETNDTSITLMELSAKTQYNISLSACLQESRKLCSTPTYNTATTDPGPEAIIGGVFGAFILVALLVVLFLVLRRHLTNKEDRTMMPLKPLSMKMVTKIHCSRFEHHYRELEADGGYGFAEQYEMLKNVGRSEPRTAGQLPNNVSKNRYKDIIPYDSSRVCLMIQDNDETSDYINASYIPGFSSPREFIASQGPLPNTVVDFWRMVWEKKVSTIVMLAQCVEAGRPKCEQYWPDDHQPHNCGEFVISLLRVDNLDHWIVRALQLHNTQFQETRQVSHYHFQRWPDHGVPNTTTQLIDFVSVLRTDLNRTEVSESTIVHCSAGVGRTGTFIALDQAIQQLEEEDMVELNKIVKNMRTNRCMMVQTELQYKFLYTCVRDYLKSKTGQVVGNPVYQNTHPAYQDQNNHPV